MINVYAWPPVAVVGSEWTEESPIQSSRSMLTGKEYISAYARKRKLVTLSVSSLSLNRSGAGYTEMLKRLLDGGINAVRLNSYPINWWVDAPFNDPSRQSYPLDWESSSLPLDWESGGLDLGWYTGTIIFGTISNAGTYTTVTIAGLPPNRVIARPAEFITVYEDETDQEGATVQILREAVSDESGVAVIYCLDELSNWGTVRVNIGTRVSAVFRALEMPRAVQPVSGNWSYTWKFREVFADEVGGFTEIDPWN